MGGRREPRVFVGVMKYFMHILMGHEKFLKVFDGSQNFFAFYFHNLVF